MKIVLTGACGFAGSTIAGALLGARDGLEIVGLDNLSRPGSELNRTKLAKLGIKLLHLDIRNQSDVDALDRADWVCRGKSERARRRGGWTNKQPANHRAQSTWNGQSARILQKASGRFYFAEYQPCLFRFSINRDQGCGR